MTPSRFLSPAFPTTPSTLPVHGLHGGRARTRGIALTLAAALVVPLSGCATPNADSSASASASVDGSLAVSRGVAPVNEEREGYRLFSGRGPVDEAVFEGPSGAGSYSYIEFERRGEPTAPMRVSLRDEGGTSVEFPAGESGEMGGVWVRNTAEAPSASASGSGVSLSATRVTASTSNLADDAQWVVSVRSLGVDSSGELTAPEGLALAQEVVTELDLPHTRIMTLAGHDSTNVKDVLPTVMLFVPSHKGITHNEYEFTSDEDMLAGLQMLTATLRRVAQGELG